MMGRDREQEIKDDIAFLRRAWLDDGRKEYKFWALMMGIYTGTWPGAVIEDIDAGQAEG